MYRLMPSFIKWVRSIVSGIDYFIMNLRKSSNTKNRSDAISYLHNMYGEHLEAIHLLSSSKRELISLLGFDSKFTGECDIKNLDRFELLLNPKKEEDKVQAN
jgi:hypothetical protein